MILIVSVACSSVKFERAVLILPFPESESMTGNPVRIGDGCATVWGDKFPSATGLKGSGRRKQGYEPQVRIPVDLLSSESHADSLLRQ